MRKGNTFCAVTPSVNLSFGKQRHEKTGRADQYRTFNSKKIAVAAKSIDADQERNPGEE